MQLTNSLLHALLVADDQSYNGPTSPYYNASQMSVGAQLTQFADGDPANSMPGSWQQPDLDGWTVATDRFDDPATGFGGVVYKRPSGDGTTFDYIVALQGTRGPNAQDWHGNLTYGWEKFVGVKGQLLMDYLTGTGESGIRDKTRNIHFTGQSLGGALAQYVAYRYTDLRETDLKNGTFSKDRMSLTSFNGLGGVEALSKNYQRDFGKAFNPSLLTGVATAHYWITNDIVSRLVPNLNGAGNEYRLDFRRDAMWSGTALSIADAHRIESGFYRGFSKFGVDFDSAARLGISHLNIGDVAKVGTAWANIFNNARTGDGEATARLISALMLGVAYGPVEQVEALTMAALDHLHADGTLDDAKYAFAREHAAEFIRGIAQSPAGITTQGRAWLLASILNLTESTGTSTLADSASYMQAVQFVDGAFATYATELENPDRQALSDLDAILRKALGLNDSALSLKSVLAAAVILGPTAFELAATPVPTLQSIVANSAAQAQILDALKNSVDASGAFLRSFAQAAIANGQNLGKAIAEAASWLYEEAIETAKATGTAAVDLVGEVTDAVEDVFRSAGNAATDFINKYSDASVEWAAGLSDTLRKQLIDGFRETWSSGGGEFGGAGATGSWDEFSDGMAYAVGLGETADQKIILRPGTGPNPFDAVGGPGDVNAAAPAAINEKGTSTFTLYLPYAAGPDGQRIKLQLSGSAVNAFDAVATSGLFPLGADGSFEIVIHEGQRQATFALAELRDVDASETLGLTATLLGPDGVPTHGQHLEVDLALTAIEEPTPPQQSALTGTEASEIIDMLVLAPEIPVTQPVELQGAGGADYILRRNAADVVVGGDGNDWITGWDEAGNSTATQSIDGGQGNDLISSLGGKGDFRGGAGNDFITGTTHWDWTAGQIPLPGVGSSLTNPLNWRFVLWPAIGAVFSPDYKRVQYQTTDGSFSVTNPGSWQQDAQGNFTLAAGPGLVAGSGTLGGDPAKTWIYRPGESLDLYFNGEIRERWEIYPDIQQVEDQKALSIDGGDGDDALVGAADKDVIVGGAGGDLIQAGSGDDTVYGDVASEPSPTNQPDGDDQIALGAGDDYALAGGGNDVVWGGGGVDTAFGGIGSDVLYGDGMVAGPGGDDYLDGGDGDDLLYGAAGADTLSGGTGNDFLYGDHSFNAQAEMGDDVLDGGDGDDHIWGHGGADDLRGGDGLDRLVAGTGDDFLDGGDGADELWGEEGRDTIHGGDGNDYLDGGDDGDQLFAGDGADSLFGGDGDDTLKGENGNDSIDGETGDDVLSGGGNDDDLFGGEGNDRMEGGAGEDTLTGEAGSDTLIGGTGTDYLEGGAGADRYVFGPGDGPRDAQGRVETVVESGGDTTFAFAGGITRSQVTVRRNGSTTDLLVSYAASDAFLIVNGSALAGAAFEFADGSVASLDEMLSAGINGGDGSDTIRGFDNRNDTIHGGAGNDIITGGTGDDILYGDGGSDQLAGGLGNDAIDGGAENDTISGDEGNDVLLGGAGNDAISDNQGKDRLEGGEGDDNLSGGYDADILIGGRGVDSLSGGTQVDTYVFNVGDGAKGGNGAVDTITDSDADSVIQLGTGIQRPDVLARRESGTNAVRVQYGPSDAFVFNDALTRRSVIVRFADGTQTTLGDLLDTSLFGGGGADVINGSDLADVIDGGDGNDSIYARAGDDTLIGGAGDDHLYGDSGSDTLEGGTGNDRLEGGGGPDVYRFGLGSGQDVLYNSDGDALGVNADTIRLGPGLTTSNVVAKRDGSDLVLHVVGESDGLRVSDYFGYGDTTTSGVVENIVFEDGTNWDVATIRSMVLVATEGDDLLIGYESSADTLNGGGGDDSIEGLNGSDILDGGIGADRVIGGFGDDRIFGGEGDDRVFGDEGDDIVEGGPGNDTLSDSGGINVLRGGDGRDDLGGGRGDDVLEGGAGDDTLNGWEGSDTYLFGIGSGHDTIFNNDYDSALGEKPDTLLFGPGVTPGSVVLTRSGDDLKISLAGTDDTVMVKSYFYQDMSWPANIVEVLKFDDGTVWDIATVKAKVLLGGDANDSLTGYAGNDLLSGAGGGDWLYGRAGNDQLDGGVGNDGLLGGDGDDSLSGGAGLDSLNGEAGGDRLDGGLGNDLLYGGRGNDIYLFARGDGQDRIGEEIDPPLAQTDSDADELRFAEGILPSDVVLSRVGFDLVIAISGTTDSLTMMEFFAPETRRVERIVFANGVTWLTTDVVAATSGVSVVGTSGNDTLTGGPNADTLSGMAGNDVLDGGPGADTLTGGAGDDTYRLDSAPITYLTWDEANVVTPYVPPGQPGPWDSVSENAGEGSDTVIASVSYALGSNVENLTLIGSVGLTAIGNSLNNVLTGGSGQDRLYGGGGADTMRGGGGSDTYFVDSVADIVVEAGDEGYEHVFSSVSYTLPINVEGLTLVGAGDINGTGNAGDNWVEGNAGSNTLLGGNGNDALTGGVAGVDTLDGGLGDDTYIVRSDSSGVTVVSSVDATPDKWDHMEFGFSAVSASVARQGDDLLFSFSGSSAEAVVKNYFAAISPTRIEEFYFDDEVVWTNDDVLQHLASGSVSGSHIVGTSGNDTILGTPGPDLIDAGAGNDLLTGGLGNDALNGQEDDDQIDGGWGNDTLDGGSGADRMAGGVGDDVYVVDGLSDQIVENVGEGTDTIRTAIDFVLPGNVENLTLTGTSAVNATGNILNNALTGNSGNNTLSGGGGTDTLAGAAGDDTYVVDSTDDVVQEAFDEGTDTVLSGVTLTLATNVENLTLTGTSAINATGNTLNNVLAGNSGANTLSGGGGTDTLAGAAGDDTFVVDSADDIVQENAGEGTDLVQSSASYTLSANVENLTLTGTSAINATGNSLNNVLTGNSGNNTLDGGDGNDTMAGGASDDSYIVDAATDVVTEAASAGTDTVLSSVTLTLSANVENLTLTGTSAINATGNALNNVLTGNSAANALSGGGGTDTLAGSAGDDTYVVDSTDDVVQENAGEGTDLVQSSASYTLSAHVENLTLTGGSWTSAAGNALDNTLTGNSGNNTLDGGAGNDTMVGGMGDDTYVVDSTTDLVTEASGAGTDIVQSGVSYTLSANVENLTLTGTEAINATGNTLNNVLTGNSGANTLSGGGGEDRLEGKGGDDVYVVDSADDAVIEAVGGGDDSVESSASVSLSANVEQLRLTGIAAINGVGNSLDNVLTGNAGANVLVGGDGNDRLDGGGGSDSLDGGNGNDVYFVSGLDNGTVTISSTDATSGKQDVLELGQTSATTTIGRSGSDLIFSFSSSGGSAIVKNYFAAVGGTTVERVRFADGMQLTPLDIALRLLTATEGDDVLSGTHLDDTITALGGNDAVQGSLGNDRLSGGAGADRLYGEEGNDWLDGGSGDDELYGGIGNDVYAVDSEGDQVIELAGAGTDTVESSVSYGLSANVENLTLTGTGAINAAGNTLNNVLMGNSGNNTLDGGTGNDTMSGGAGDDTYVVDTASDVVTEEVGSGIDTAQSSVTLTLSANVENLTLTGTGAINATGNSLDNTLTGNSGNNTLDGGVGNDTMAGGVGNDTYVVDALGDQIQENAGEGTDLVQTGISLGLAENVENLTLTGTGAINATGNSLNNVLTGNSGNNTLDGGAANDTMVGGAGDDTYVVDSTSDIVTEAASAGTDTVLSNVTLTLATNVENLTLTGTGAINATGNTLNNVLTGNSGANTLSGGGGTDTLAGGAGDDTYVVDSTDDVVQENAGEGTDLVQSSASYTLSANVENLTLTGTSTINATGNALNNVLTGNTAANVLTGGAGNDTYVVQSAADTVVENAADGTDTVESSISFALSANVENLTLTGTGAINATGNSLNNVLTGNSGNNTLDGGAGSDTMAGGAGNDTYIVDATTDVVTEAASAGTDTVLSSVTLTLAANVENLTLTGTSAINATGNVLNNVLTGNTEANVLAGGAGNDTYVVQSAADTVVENAAEGTDTVQSSDSYTLSANVENLTLTGTGAINATGNSLNNVLTGNSGNNTLDGGAANDTMVGGAGDDTYVVDSTSDIVTEAASAGTDTVLSSVTLTLATNVENLTLTGAGAINGTGNSLANLVRGNVAVNTLNGGTGNDLIEAGDGNDVMNDTSGTAWFNGGAGTDTISGGASAEIFVGGLGNDTINTGNGADIIVYNKGEGSDIINGGTGTDNVLSLGGGLRYADLKFRKVTNDLVMEVGATESITFKNWYVTSANNKTVSRLQLMLEATSDYNAASADPTLNKKVEQFDFAGLVTQFDQALAATPTLTSWALTNALSTFYLASSSDTAALGGDLAYYYGRDGNVTGMTTAAAQDVIGSASLGTANQTLRPFAGISGGVSTLQ